MPKRKVILRTEYGAFQRGYSNLKSSLMHNLSARDFFRPSMIILILANLLPIFGVIFLGWKVFPILFLYWVENVIIGFFNVLKMASASPANGNSKVAKLLLIVIKLGIDILAHLRQHAGGSASLIKSGVSGG